MLIQIVEDDRALSDGIRLALREPGITFVQNANVRQAKAAFEKEAVELIILDINLPDGRGTFCACRAHADGQRYGDGRGERPVFGR